jgi:hypothetical protein
MLVVPLDGEFLQSFADEHVCLGLKSAYLPGVSSNRFSDGSQGAERGEVVTLKVLGTELSQKSDGSRSGVLK